eukprot:CAMPEP_0119036202 /NCGR_PEP_ID=MMETSP1177-20130426/3730_1 /TAXON_ID=2985 /ORGANISM="Ochromonas sp, Strain CCMP1899" /LENGTH=304 /DNA_ID=CAMNT_0006995647 /DNA_START=244 /DNA_END=1158 /DNA_ORIENTATION=+
MGPVLASAFCVAAIMYPLDLIRGLEMAAASDGLKATTGELLNNFRSIYGIQGFFTQGLAPELLRSTYMRFVKFSLFPIAHMALTGVSEKSGTALTKAMAAIVASFPEAISIMPLEIAKTSLQLDTGNRFKNNMLTAMSTVYKEKGVKGFTVGYLGVQYRQAMWTAGYFASIKFFEQRVEQAIKLVKGQDFDMKKDQGLTVFSQLVSGFCAGVFGAMINTPGDTVRTVVQKRVLGSLPGTIQFLEVGKEIVKTRGFGGLYAGFKFKSLHLGGGGALMAFFLPFFKKVFAVQPPVTSTGKGSVKTN